MNTKKRLFEVMRYLNPDLNEAYIDDSGNLKDFDTDDDTSYQGINIETFPPNVKKTLEDEYGDFSHNFDWNTKQDEYEGRGEEFQKWFKKNTNEQLYKNIDDIIRKTTQDMILIKKQEIAKKKRKAFEELIIPALGNDILLRKLSEFEANVLMSPSATIESIEKGFKEAKNIMDAEGNIDSSKLTTDMVTGINDDNIVNIAEFQNYIKKNPEYRGIYDDWMKLLDDDHELMLKELHAFRNSTGIESIRELRNFLIKYRDTNGK